MSEDLARAEAQRRFGDDFDSLCRYVDILSGRGLEWGLLGPREGERLWDRHALNSTALEGFVPPDSLVVDVGSGAGLPGIPLAILRPDLTITLLEPLQRRAEFLELTTHELGLSERVRIVRARAEDHDERYDVVTCRAVANLTTLLGWVAPLLGIGQPDTGRLVALKGRSAADEVEAASGLLSRLGMTARVEPVVLYDGAEPTYVVEVAPTR